jgi:hypothetical protein
MKFIKCSRCGAHNDFGERCDCAYKTEDKHEQTETQDAVHRRTTPFEHTRAAVYATGNKWAIENFHATHD